MGAEFFGTYSKGKTAHEAFTMSKNKAYHDYGHSGYTGSIAENLKSGLFEHSIRFYPNTQSGFIRTEFQ